ncbi:MAG: hypothetical protein MI867_11145 [Pseudomonadales bacterium]|nr:hypothetical protein [Pseudomonadales bacterium]
MPENNSQGDDQGMKSSGVQSLIDRLQQEGVAAGREQGERIVTDAEKRAAWLIQQAKEEAEQIVSKANAESEFIKQAGQEALQMAVRDSQLFLKNHLMNTFAAQLNSMVSQALSNSDLLEKMILEIAHQARPQDQSVKILMGEMQPHSKDEKLNEEVSAALIQFVSEHGAQLLEKGVEIEVLGDPQASLRLQLKEQNAEVVLNDRTVSALILQHIQPRFKTLLEGLMS